MTNYYYHAEITHYLETKFVVTKSEFDSLKKRWDFTGKSFKKMAKNAHGISKFWKNRVLYIEYKRKYTCKHMQIKTLLKNKQFVGEKKTNTFTYLEPINSTAVDKWGELSQTIAKSISNWAERYYNMEIFFAAVNKKCK